MNNGWIFHLISSDETNNDSIHPVFRGGGAGWLENSAPIMGGFVRQGEIQRTIHYIVRE